MKEVLEEVKRVQAKECPENGGPSTSSDDNDDGPADPVGRSSSHEESDLV